MPPTRCGRCARISMRPGRVPDDGAWSPVPAGGRSRARRRATRDWARRTRGGALLPPQPVAVDRRGDLRGAEPGDARLRAAARAAGRGTPRAPPSRVPTHAGADQEAPTEWAGRAGASARRRRSCSVKPCRLGCRAAPAPDRDGCKAASPHARVGGSLPPSRPSQLLSAPLSHAPPGAKAPAATALVLLSRGHWWTRRSTSAGRGHRRAREAAARLAAMAAPHGGWPAVQEPGGQQPRPPGTCGASSGNGTLQGRRGRPRSRQLAGRAAALRAVPAHTREAPPHLYYLYYRSPAPFDPSATLRVRGDADRADMPRARSRRELRAMNDSVMMLNHVIHHGAIGHHVQNHHAYRGLRASGRSRRWIPPTASLCSAAAASPRAGPVMSAT